MVRSLLAGLALLGLTACDAALDAEDVVGTWTAAAYRTETQVTVGAAQSVLDPAAPFTGSVAVSGSETAGFPYLQQVTPIGSTGLSALFRSVDPSAAPPPARSLVLTFADDPGNASLQVQVEGSETVIYVPTAEADPLFARSGFTVRFPGVPLVAADGGGRAVRLDGAVTFGSRDLPADVPTTIREADVPLSETQVFSYTFAADGSFAVRTAVFGEVLTRTGTWSASGDRVVVTAPLDRVDQPITVDFEASLSRGTLRLTRITPFDACDSGCVSSAEARYGLRPGTLRSGRFVTTTTFTRAAPAA